MEENENFGLKKNDIGLTVGCLLLAYFMGRKVGRVQTLRMVKALSSCSCSQ